MNLSRKLLVTAATLAMSAGSLALTTTQASAVSGKGCDWPKVCFYLTQAKWNANSPTAAFQDMDYWQTLGSQSRGSKWVWNSRNDDGALLHFTDGHTMCLSANSYAYVGGYTVDKIKIVNPANC
ncbi:hypothetical protein [Streptodolium elevatio]|uniref:Peptidase inhibitor family I36 n=1 Tax=Streptodolium elevatio TaxID=3157996 RepID=A0ABV3DDQ5_9ACTN